MMNFLSLLAVKSADAYGARPAVLGIIGDSVSNGCFEVLDHSDGGIEAVYDTENNYASILRRMLMTLYPHGQLNIVNAAINGDSAPGGLRRVYRDLIPYKPDLTVICYGLNDVNGGPENLGNYREAMTGLIRAVKAAGSEVIVMTPQPMNYYVHKRILSKTQREIAEKFAALQNGGVLDLYIDCARETAAAEGAVLCDCYERWMYLRRGGVDTTALLSNLLNHPSREMHLLFAYELARTMFETET
ncbi:MAG: SGNH/GDSL hydrolase family protein [Eubacteriales bacterium]